MPDTFLYLETRGRSSGRLREIEIWFVLLAERFYIVAEMGERAGWVKNIRAHERVSFCVGTRDDKNKEVRSARAMARVVDAQLEPALVSSVRALMETKYAWSDGLIVELAPER
jgi:hypothetical protein